LPLGYDAILLYLCEPMRRCGRGFTYLHPARNGATVPMPVADDPWPSFMQAVCELTHHLSEPLVAAVLGVDPNARSPNAGDEAGYATHTLFENAVIQANY
jgi:hypothetical protein